MGTTVVVGGAGGIGEAVSRALAAASWTDRLVIADLRLDMAASLAEGIRQDGADAEAIQMDITDPASISALVASTPGADRLAILAGIHTAASSLETTWADFERLLRVNLTGTFFVAQAYARAMAEQGAGAIVAVSSVTGRLPRIDQAAYAASKAGMSHALRCLGLEVAPLGVRINLVAPGATDTPMLRDQTANVGRPLADVAGGSLERFRPRIPDGRVADPEQVASAIEYLLSPAAAHVVLHELVVDGGETLGR